MLADRRNCWGFSLFCDDVRLEVGGKQSLMGLYQSDLILNEPLPIILPRLVVYIMYYELAGTISEDVKFTVQATPSDADQPIMLLELPLPRKDMPTIDSLPVPINPDDGERIFHARIPIVISPFEVPKDCVLRVRAQYSDGLVLRLGRLTVRARTPKEMEAMGKPVRSKSD